MKQRVAVALSGGVDSAVAALLLVSQGYDVVGVHLVMTLSGQADSQMEHARRVASQIGIPFEAVNVADAFEAAVISPFCREYAAGRTPNPCVRCNLHIKFGVLLEHAAGLGADLLATGHYARITTRGAPRLLQKGVDLRSDQSYFLYAIPASRLSRLLMPLGNLSRRQVKSMASQAGIESVQSSQDVCFVGEKNYSSFVVARAEVAPGDIVDSEGVVRGRHRGLPYYTVGQRHGLGIAMGEPRYVIRIDASQNRIVVGDATLLLARAATLHQMNWLIEPPAGDEFIARAKTRYRARCTTVRVSTGAEGTKVRFDEPQRAVAPGQSIVFYDGDTVMGGGVIVESHQEAADAETGSSAKLE